jgi:hypothetical protein
MSDTDLDKYRRHIDHFDMPTEHKTELLRALWRIMQSFVDRAFGDDPAQHVLEERQARKLSLADNPHICTAPEDAAVIDLDNKSIPEPDKKLAGDFRASAKGKRRRK